MNLADFETAVTTRCKDNAAKLTTSDQDDSIKEAVKRYSKDRPRVLVCDLPGQGTAFLNLPSIAAVQNVSNAVNFEDGFSDIETIEFPIGDVPPTFLYDFQWQMYRAPSGLQIMLTDVVPTDSDTLRVTWTARHDPGTSGQNAIATTVPDADFEAVSCLAAAIQAEKLASVYAQTNDSTISADAVSYRTKSQEYQTLAKTLRKRYFDHLGVEEGDTGGASSPAAPALAIGDMDLMQGSGVDRLTHRRPR